MSGRAFRTAARRGTVGALVSLALALALVVIRATERHSDSPGSPPVSPRPSLDAAPVSDRSASARDVLREISDASAAVAVGSMHVVVADDETNVLRAYLVGTWGLPVARFDLGTLLVPGSPGSEVDIEGAARIGEIAYWIGSHGRDAKSAPRPSRQRLFATRIAIDRDGAIACDPVGTPYAGLAEAMLSDPALAVLRVARNAEVRRGRARGDDGLNIEALDASADGRTLFVGLRSPLAAPSGGEPARAIVVPLENPHAMLARGERPRFADPLLWDLDESAIRAMTYSAADTAHFIVAGPSDGGRGFTLYRWSGVRTEPPRFVRALDGDGDRWKPEALVAVEGKPSLLALSDDGDVRVPVHEAWRCEPDELRDGSCPNKRLRVAADRTSRLRWIEATPVD